MGSMLAVFVVVVAGFIAALYALRLQPKTHRQWILLAITIAFLAWILPFMAALR